ncbi:hypothetical protein ELUMI_v1c00860 [Williamsoniiplasma luminosum]|uniref:Folate family ECF transporter S component n=1 Tax=Williamsoniiplasma luminosum TaxID=214888 RepID=A0A2K8NSS8_9MOLU|nr:folate family ECF transporter S component [Williamsoniiplasma luminosum]ATZ16814.1 hypothetical protein ELUMI_v1c00860 [Williamsoniiplasma luminosum]
MYFILTNTLSILAIIVMFIGSIVIEKFSYKRLTIYNITVLGVLTALSIIFTNIIGYNINIMGSRFMIGNFIIFLAGMLFGPIAGILNGIAADLVGTIINSAGQFNAGFMLIKVVYGVMGALVFLDRKNSWWIFKSTIYMGIALFLHLMVLNPLLMITTYTEVSSFETFFQYYWLNLLGTFPKPGVPKPLLFIIELPIYVSSSIVSFRVIYFSVARIPNRQGTIWCAKSGDLGSILRKKKKVLAIEHQENNVLSHQKDLQEINPDE